MGIPPVGSIRCGQQLSARLAFALLQQAYLPPFGWPYFSPDNYRDGASYQRGVLPSTQQSYGRKKAVASAIRFFIIENSVIPAPAGAGAHSNVLDASRTLVTRAQAS